MLRYNGNTFTKDSFPLVDGTTNFTAIATDSYGRWDTNTVTVNLPATTTVAYDLNGNLRTSGSEILEYDDENQLVTNWVVGAWKSEFVYDGKLRRGIERECRFREISFAECAVTSKCSWTGFQSQTGRLTIVSGQ